MTDQTYSMTVADVTLYLERKPVKYLRIKVRPPMGRVEVSVPLGMSDDAVRHIVLSKIDWIRKYRLRFAKKQREAPLQYVSDEKIKFKGRNYVLKVAEQGCRPHVRFQEPGPIDLYVKPGSNSDTRRKVLNTWYRKELKATIPGLMDKWQLIMGVQATEWRIKQMKTRWGTCNVRARRIWINLELIKQPVHLLEFIIVHELTHLLEPSHNSRFKLLMDGYMPDWRQRQAQLKQRQPGGREK